MTNGFLLGTVVANSNASPSDIIEGFAGSLLDNMSFMLTFVGIIMIMVGMFGFVRNFISRDYGGGSYMSSLGVTLVGMIITFISLIRRTGVSLDSGSSENVSSTTSSTAQTVTHTTSEAFGKSHGLVESSVSVGMIIGIVLFIIVLAGVAFGIYYHKTHKTKKEAPDGSEIAFEGLWSENNTEINMDEPK